MRSTKLVLSGLLLPSLTSLALLATGCSVTADTPPGSGSSGNSGSTGPDDPQAIADARSALPAQIDGLMDLRFEATDDDRAAVAASFVTSKLTFAELDTVLRAGRASYPAPNPAVLGQTTKGSFSTYITDYSGSYYLYVPAGYDASKAWPLVFIAHGGDSAMSTSFAESTAADYMKAYRPGLGEDGGAILVAPATTVGWLGVGNVILFDTISQLSRRFHIDPDHISVAGQSMGGHMSYRTALNFGDRFAAFSPQSGGYDYTAAAQGDVIANLFGTSAYVTYGTAAKGELYGIGDANNINKAWLTAHHYDWTMVEEDGGHDIYAQEQPNVAKFFAAHARNPYAKRTYHKGGGAMAFTTERLDTWTRGFAAVPGRTLRWNARHWLEVTPRADLADNLTFYGEVKDGNRIEIDVKNVRHLRVYVHPSMGLDLAQPITVVVNGDQLSSAAVTPTITTYLEQLRDFDDRGRLFWGAIDLDVTTDHDVADPTL